MPNLLQSKSGLNQPAENKPPPADLSHNNNIMPKSSFLYLHVAKCKRLSGKDVELIKKLLTILNELSFHSYIKFESN